MPPTMNKAGSTPKAATISAGFPSAQAASQSVWPWRPGTKFNPIRRGEWSC